MVQHERNHVVTKHLTIDVPWQGSLGKLENFAQFFTFLLPAAAAAMEARRQTSSSAGRAAASAAAASVFSPP